MEGTYVIGMVGTNGTGKSSTEEDLIMKYKKDNPRHDVIGYHPHGRLLKHFDFRIDYTNREWAKAIHKHVRNSLVVLDDYKGLCPNFQPTPGMRDMFIDRGAHAHNNCYIYCAHGPGSVIEMLTEYTTHWFIYYCTANEGKWDKKANNAYLCITASRMVNEYVSKYGKGMHPKDTNFQGQKFPYAIVDTLKKEITAQNFSQKFDFKK